MKKIILILSVLGAFISLVASDSNNSNNVNVSVNLKKVNLNECKACHGFNFERSALSKSKIVANLSKEEIVEALKKYKNKEAPKDPYFKVMKTHVSKYTDDEIENIASKITQLNKNKGE